MAVLFPLIILKRFIFEPEKELGRIMYHILVIVLFVCVIKV